MAHGLNSTKSHARPSRQAIEHASESSIDAFKTASRKMNNFAMRIARRAQNRLLDNEQRLPGSTIFSK
jgi:hypothetical protein